MTKQTILVGTAEEIAEHCEKLSKDYREELRPASEKYRVLTNDELLCTKQGFLDQIKTCDSINMGLIYYLSKWEEKEKSGKINEVDIELKSVYFRVQKENSFRA